MFRYIFAFCFLLSTSAAAAPKGCFSAKELFDDQLVRHAMMLRDKARNCDRKGYTATAASRWNAVETANAERFKQTTGSRQKALARELGENSQDYRIWTFGMSTSWRNWSPNEAECQNLEKRLVEVEKRGWKVFAEMAKAWRHDVVNDFRKCD